MVVLGEWLVRLWCPRICCGHCGAGVRGVVGVCGDVFTVVMSMSEGNGAVAAQEPVVVSRSEGSGAAAAQGISLSFLP